MKWVSDDTKDEMTVTMMPGIIVDITIFRMPVIFRLGKRFRCDVATHRSKQFVVVCGV